MTGNPLTRLVVVPVIRDESGSVLVCRMAEDRGVFPGQWALPGGGVEPGEQITDALHREVREELGVEVTSARPLYLAALLTVGLSLALPLFLYARESRLEEGHPR